LIGVTPLALQRGGFDRLWQLVDGPGFLVTPPSAQAAFYMAEQLLKEEGGAGEA
jgi:hypothetical protein